MILSTWNFEYALALQSTKTILFSLFETCSEFINALCLSKVHFHQSGLLKLIKTITFVRLISSMDSLFKR